MARSKYGVILALFLCVGLLGGCSGDSADPGRANAGLQAANKKKEGNNATRTNVEELGVLIKVPFEAEDIVWKEFPEKKRILAVIRFSAVNANKIVAEAGGTPQGVSIAVESWFPDELVAQADAAGDNSLKGIGYPATAFYQEPYNTGMITRIEGTDYFILDVNSK